VDTVTTIILVASLAPVLLGAGYGFYLLIQEVLRLLTEEVQDE